MNHFPNRTFAERKLFVFCVFQGFLVVFALEIFHTKSIIELAHDE